MRPDCKTEKDAPFLVILPFQKWQELELNLQIDALKAVADDLSTSMVTSAYPPLHSTMLLLVDNFLLFLSESLTSGISFDAIFKRRARKARSRLRQDVSH